MITTIDYIYKDGKLVSEHETFYDNNSKTEIVDKPMYDKMVQILEQGNKIASSNMLMF